MNELHAPLRVVLRNRTGREETYPNTRSVTEDTEEDKIRVKFRVGDAIYEDTFDVRDWRIVDARMQEVPQ